MSKPFDYPSEWISQSDKDPAKLATAIHKNLAKLGCKVAIIQASNSSMVGWNYVLQSTGFNIKIKEMDWGCTLEIYIFEEDLDTLKFLHLWKFFIDKDYVWDGPYKKDLKPKADNIISHNEKELKVNKVQQKHLAMWKMIKPLYENGSTFTDMQKAIVEKKRIGKGKGENIATPSVNTIRIIIEKYGGTKNLNESD